MDSLFQHPPWGSWSLRGFQNTYGILSSIYKLSPSRNLINHWRTKANNQQGTVCCWLSPILGESGLSQQNHRGWYSERLHWGTLVLSVQVRIQELTTIKVDYMPRVSGKQATSPRVSCRIPKQSIFPGGTCWSSQRLLCGGCRLTSTRAHFLPLVRLISQDQCWVLHIFTICWSRQIFPKFPVVTWYFIFALSKVENKQEEVKKWERRMGEISAS